jgi:GH24 family phage-related lysozyme (muramidase)
MKTLTYNFFGFHNLNYIRIIMKVKAAGRVLPGLTSRRAAEAALMR